MITVTLNIAEENAVIETKVLDALAKKFNTVMQHVKSGVIVGIQDLCDKLIARTPEYMALMHHDPLLGELGIPEVERRLEGILLGVKRGITADVIPIRRQGKMISGSIVFGIIPSDLTYLLLLPESSYMTERGREIPWLDWLTQQGDRIIIGGFDVMAATSPAAKARSRTGLALMVKGGNWRVPPEFAGFEHDNFLTRAFDVPGIERAIANIIVRELKLRL